MGLVLSLAGARIADASPLVGIEIDNPLTEEEFQQRIRASFGFLTAREPTLNPAEYAILDKFIDFLDDDGEFAITMIEGLTENNSDLSASFDFILGNLYMQVGMKEKAERSFKVSIEKYPDYLRAWRALGMLYLDSNDIENSLVAYSKAIQLGDTEPSTFGQIGFCFYDRKEYLSALSAYTQAILYDPRNIEWIKGKVAVLTTLEDYRQASIILQDLVKRHPDVIDFWLAQANNFVMLEEPLKAANSLEFLRSMGQAPRPSLQMLGSLYLQESMYLQAYDVYKEMLADSMDVRNNSILLCSRMLYTYGLKSKAQDLLDDYVDMRQELSNEERASVLLYRSQLAEDAKEWKKAKGFLEEALKLNPEEGEILIVLAKVLYDSGEVGEAYVALSRAEQFPSLRIDALVMAAQMLAQEKHFLQAEEKLQDALANGAGDWVRRYYNNVQQQARKVELDRLALSQYYGEED